MFVLKRLITLIAAFIVLMTLQMSGEALFKPCSVLAVKEMAQMDHGCTTTTTATSVLTLMTGP